MYKIHPNSQYSNLVKQNLHVYLVHTQEMDKRIQVERNIIVPFIANYLYTHIILLLRLPLKYVDELFTISWSVSKYGDSTLNYDERRAFIKSVFSVIYLNSTHTYEHTHSHIYIYIYIMPQQKIRTMILKIAFMKK